MGLELTPREQLRIEQAALSGRELPDGPCLTTWTPASLAMAIEHEVARARVVGWPKVSLHFDLEDAAAFAAWLRRRDRSA